MASRTVVKAQLESWLELITASTIGAGDGLMVRWKGESVASEGWRETPAWAECYLSRPTTVGRDITVYEYDSGADPGEEMTQSQLGHRRITLEVQVWSPQGSGSDDAGEFTRRIRDRLHLDDWDTYFETAEVAVAAIADDRDLTQIVDGWEHTVAQLDIRLNAFSLEEGSPTTYVETVVDATLEVPEGTEQWVGDLDVV